MEYRKATLGDIETLVRLRKIQLIDEGLEPNTEIDGELFAFFENKLASGELIQWLAEDDGEIVGCGAVIFYDFPPSYTNVTGRKAYFANMYTKDDYRGQGIASHILNLLVEEVKKTGITNIWLIASTLGKPVYKKFGFQEADNILELKI